MFRTDGPTLPPDPRPAWCQGCPECPKKDATVAKLTEALDSYREKADAIHRYLTKKKFDGLMAVLTELSLDSARRAADRSKNSEGGKK